MPVPEGLRGDKGACSGTSQRARVLAHVGSTGQCSVNLHTLPGYSGHAQPTAPAVSPELIPLPFAAQDRHPPSASLSESGQCDFHSEIFSNFIEQNELLFQKQKDKEEKH